MKKLAYIFGIALFLFGCGANYYIVDVSYNPINPIDPPRQFFTPKDKQSLLYFDPVIDNREFAEHGRNIDGRFEEDPTIIRSIVGQPLSANLTIRTSKPVTDIIGEAR